MSRSDDDARSAPTCAVCYDDVDDASLARLPCCGARARASTTQFCAKCVEILIQTGDGVAACPRCRAAIARVDGAFVAAPLRRCAVCRQARATGETCEACALGGRAALRYRCERCGGAQRIPHPMWRYMASPTSLSSATWACHGACGDYTRWRIDSRDAASVPASDAPASWGSSEAWLAAAREAVERARASEARLEGARTTRVGEGVKAGVMVALWAAAAAMMAFADGPFVEEGGGGGDARSSSSSFFSSSSLSSSSSSGGALRRAISRSFGSSVGGANVSRADAAA